MLSSSRQSPMQAPKQMLLGQHQVAAKACRRLPLLPKQAPCPGKLSNSCANRLQASSSHSRPPDGPDISTGVSFASLPVSQQAIGMAFQVLDKDEDGRISRSEACRLVAYYLALQHHKPPPAQRRPLTWDQHLLSSINTASKLSGGSWTGVAASCEAYVGAKMAGGLQAHPPRCSDLVWGAAGVAAAVLVLGVLAAAARTLPVVGQWHQQGVPLLLGSFGTLAILLFGKPEAEPVRLWPIIAGQVGATAIVMAVLHIWGANLISRAAAMGATVAWMMWSDCIHPPGGTLVLMAMDNVAIQRMSWSYILWPSLMLSLTVLLPISAATNHLRRNYQFDAPWTEHGAASLQQKVQEFQQQQAAKQAAMLRQWRALELDRGFSGKQSLHGELHSPLARLVRIFRPILQLIGFRKVPSQQQQLQQQQRGVITTASGERYQVRGVSLDLGVWNLGQSVADAGPAEQAAAAALENAIRRKLQQEQERSIEDKLHRRRVWGGYEQNPDYRKLTERINELQQRQQQQQQQQRKEQEGREGGSEKPMKPPVGWRPQQQPQQPPQQPTNQAGSGHQQQQQQQKDGEDYDQPLVSPRQRLEQYWEFRAVQQADSRSSSRLGTRSSSPQLKERQQKGDSSGRSSSRQGPMDSFAPDEEC